MLMFYFTTVPWNSISTSEISYFGKITFHTLATSYRQKFIDDLILHASGNLFSHPSSSRYYYTPQLFSSFTCQFSLINYKSSFLHLNTHAGALVLNGDISRACDVIVAAIVYRERENSPLFRFNWLIKTQRFHQNEISQMRVKTERETAVLRDFSNGTLIIAPAKPALLSCRFLRVI